MKQVIRALLPEEQLPEGADEIASLYHTVLRGQRALIFLDDARDVGQVEPLLPPPGSVLLVTSRSRFVLPGVHSLTLDGLEGNDAPVLLQRLAPRTRIDGATAAELAALCGSVPLVLRLAAGALSMRPDISPEMYAERLQDAQGRYERIDAALSVSFDLLDPVLQTLWPRLAFLTFDFSARAASTMFNDAFPSMDKALSDLVAYGMLDEDPSAGLYAVPRAAQRFAMSYLGEDYRIVGEYWCRSLGNPYSDAQRPRYHAALGDPISVARRSQNRHAEAWALGNLANIDDMRSVVHAEQGASIFRAVGNRLGELWMLGKLMLFYASIDDERRVVAVCKRWMAVTGDHDMGRPDVGDFYALSLLYDKLGKPDKATEAIQIAVDRELHGQPTVPQSARSTQLFAAIEQHDASRIAELLADGHDPNALQAKLPGFRPLHAAIHELDRGGGLDVVAMLLEHGADVDGRNAGRDLTPLLAAVLKGQRAAIELILKAGADPNVVTSNMDSPLQACARTGDCYVASLLLAAGAGRTINERDWRSNHALGLAAYRLDLSMMRMLLAAGADPDATDEDDEEYDHLLPWRVASNQDEWDAASELLRRARGSGR